MKKIDPHKPQWDDSDWIIYLNNLELLCARYGLLKKELSERAGVVNAFRKDSGRPGPETLKRIAGSFDVAVDWLLTYHDKLPGDVKEPEPDYALHGGWQPRSIEEMAGVPKGLGMGKAVEMLASIYNSKNQDVIRAIFANLQVFSSAIEQAGQIEQLKHDVEELRGLVKKHAQLHAYYGQDRRSGERRQMAGQSPTGAERRSGEDRRRIENNGDSG